MAEENKKLLLDFIKFQNEQSIKNQAAIQEACMKQQAAMAEVQQTFLKHLADTLKENVGGNGSGALGQGNTPPDEFRMESLSQGITEFEYDPEANITFDSWYSRYESLFTEDAVNLSDQSKTRLLLRKMSTRCHELYINSILPQTPKDILFAATVTRLKSIFGRQVTLFRSRYNCLQLVKSDLEDFSAYAANVNKHCEQFKWNDMTADQFKCLIFVCGLQSHQHSDIRTRLLSTIEGPDAAAATLQTLTTECNRIISLKSDTALIESQSVHAIHYRQRPRQQQQQQSSQSTPQRQQQPSQNNAHKKNTASKTSKSKPNTPCWLCGEFHYSRYCPYRSHICKTCSKKGHKEGYCDFRNKNKSSTYSNVITRVNQIRANDYRRYIKLKINNIVCDLQIDTASDITIVSEETWKKIGKPTSHPSNQSVRNASGDLLPITSEFQCTVQFGQRSFLGNCFQTSIKGLNLLGIDWIDQLGFWDVPINSICNNIKAAVPEGCQRILDNIKSRFPGVFQDSPGLCSKFAVELRVKQGARPVFRPKRPVAFAAVAEIDRELDRLQDLGIIQAVEYSQWAAPIVVVKKSNGSIRICADFSTGLNDALEPYPYPLPTPDDIFSRLYKSTFFSLIDLSDAFFQVQTHENSRELLTINTHRGLFRYHRLPFGVKVAPGAFQQVIDMMIAGLTGTSAYLDDILVSGKSKEDHDKNLTRLFERIELFGFTIKAEKCKIGLRELEYLGHIIDHRGIRPNPIKTLAIAQMPAPTDLASLRAYLGGINFYGKFVKQMHDLRNPLNQLLKKDAKWSWTPECQQSFERFKEILQSDLLLTHYDPSLELIVAGDASNHGIGACILHRFKDGSVKAIYHAHRTLTDAERNYSQIEKEGLSIIFGVTKFHRMVYGRSFILQTDHKPLLQIFGSKKGIPVYTANRLQRWALTLKAYDFSIEYVQTDHFGHADILSRLIDSHTSKDEEIVIASVILEEDVRSILNVAIDSLPLTYADIVRETQKCPTLQRVITYLTNGWPSRDEISNEVAPFLARHSSLSVKDQCLLFGERVVVPECFRQAVLHRLHQDHPGQYRMKSLARSYVYWPSMDKQIEEYVRSCSKCIESSKSPVRVPLTPWPKPSDPWKRIHIDFAGPVGGHYYLIAVDAYSKWPEVFDTSTITANYTIDMLSSLFSRFGNPEKIVSDNGTQFTSATFQKFCQDRGIQHIRTAPYHPQSNGQAERFVDTFKRSLKKFGGGGQSPHKHIESFLTTYRAIPNRSAPDGKSPAELLLGRRIRTTMDLLLPPKDQAERHITDDYMQQQYNRKHGVKPKSFAAGDMIFVKLYRNNNAFDWTPGKIIERVGNSMYNIYVETQRRKQLIRSHIDQIQARVPAKSTNDSQLPFDILMESFEITPKHYTPTKPVSEIRPELSTGSSASISLRQSPRTTPYPRSRPLRVRAQPTYLRDYELF